MAEFETNVGCVQDPSGLPEQSTAPLNGVQSNTSATPSLHQSLTTTMAPGDGMRSPVLTMQRLAQELETHLAGLCFVEVTDLTAAAHAVYPPPASGDIGPTKCSQHQLAGT